MRRHLFILFLSAVFIGMLSTETPAATYFVNAGGSIQTALDGATAGDVVMVGAGTFHENLVMKLGVELIGAGPDLSILDGGSAESVIFVPSGATAATRIEGLRITNGDGYQGGGVNLAPASSPTIANCVIEGNNSGNFGGGIYVGGTASPVIQFCTIRDNTAQEGAGIYCEGGNQGGSADIRFNVVCGNVAAVTGGGIHLVGCEGNVTLVNNTIVSNRIGFSYGSGISIVNSLATVTNNIIAFNEGGHGFMAQDSWVVTGCNVVYGNVGGDYSGVTPGPNSISEDPLFCDLGNCDVQLSSTSPAANSLECGLIGALPVGCGFTSTQVTSWGGVKDLFR